MTTRHTAVRAPARPHRNLYVLALGFLVSGPVTADAIADFEPVVARTAAMPARVREIKTATSGVHGGMHVGVSNEDGADARPAQWVPRHYIRPFGEPPLSRHEAP